MSACDGSDYDPTPPECADDGRPDCSSSGVDYQHQCQIDTPYDNPFYYDCFFNLEDNEDIYDVKIIDDMMFEYFGIHGNKIDIYLVTKYDPDPVFGEDPTTSWELPPIQAKAMMDPSAEVMKYGEFGRNTEDEELTIYLHKTSVKVAIRNLLEAYCLVDNADSLTDEELLDKYERYRLELQEKDVIRLYYNNIHYIIDGIKEEPDYQPLLRKYIYACTCRPILVSSEGLGSIQPTTEQDRMIEQNNLTVESEGNRILF